MFSRLKSKTLHLFCDGDVIPDAVINTLFFQFFPSRFNPYLNEQNIHKYFLKLTIELEQQQIPIPGASFCLVVK